MGLKQMKRRAATAMVVVMSALNVLTPLAEVGTPATNTKSIKVTFDAGNGGIFDLDQVASNSNATETDASKDSSTETKLVRVFTNLQKEDKTNFAYTSLLYGGEEKSEDYESIITAKDSKVPFQGWYYDGVKVDNKTNIYSDVTLEARWYAIEGTLDETTKKTLAVETNLPAGKTLVLNELTEEKVTQELAKNEAGQKALDEALEKADLVIAEKSPMFTLDINVEDADGNKTKSVDITMNIPDVFAEEEANRLGVVHFADDYSSIKEFIQPKDVKIKDGRMTFTMNGFSPVAIVVTEDKAPAEGEVEVMIKNVDNGYLSAYTGNWSERIYLPLEEKVTLPVNTKITLNAYGYVSTEEDEDWEGKLTSLTIDSEAGKRDIWVEDQTYYTITADQSCTIEAAFTKEAEKEEGKYSKFELSVDRQDVPGKYSSKVELSVLKEGENTYEKVDPSAYTLRIATEEDFLKANLSSYNYDMDLFTYENGMLSSKGELAADQYRVPFVITYQDKEWFVDEVYEDAYEAFFPIGVSMNFEHAIVKFGDRYSLDNGTDYIAMVRFGRDGKETWPMVEALFDPTATPQMYNYDFVGWQNYKGEQYAADSKLVNEHGTNRYYTAFDMFVSKDEAKKPYLVEAIVDGKKPTEPSTPDNPSNPNKPGNSGSSSSGGSGGGGGSSSSGGSKSTGNSYAMTGSWIADANGWKFVKSNGSSAANTWGYINGQYYYFDAAGTMVTGWYPVNGKWYYMNPAEGSAQGVMLTGVIFDPVYNAYFYADASGAMVTGWYQVGANWYYFSPVNDGVHVQGALLADTTIDGYYVGADGAWVPAN